MRYFRVFLKVKRLVPPLALSLETKIKEVKITLRLKIHSDLAMLILLTNKNMVSEIIVVAVDQVQEKQQLGLQLVQLQRSG